MNRKVLPGTLIALEGIDGCGKSTLARNLFEALKSRPFPTILTKEPGGSSLGKELRTILNAKKTAVCPKAEFLLFAADRAQHFEEVIIPALKKDSLVISDRLADSSLAYQGYGRGLDTTFITTVNAWAMNDIVPDCVIYLRLSAHEALKRIHGRNETLTSFEQEKIEFWTTVIEGFETIFKKRSNVIVLDGTLSAEHLLEQALENLNRYHLI